MTTKINTEEELDNLRLEYEKGFEDGLAVAKRLYKPIAVSIMTQNSMIEQSLINKSN